MAEAKEDNKFARVVQKFDPYSTLLRAWELRGGISARVTALEIQRPDGQTKKMIVRQHSEVAFKYNPQIAADEFKLLQRLRSVGLAVPTPYHLEQSCEIFSTPYIIIEYIEGESELTLLHIPNLLLRFASYLYTIHQIDCSQLDVSFLPQQEKKYTRILQERPAEVDASLDEGHIRDVLEAVWPFPQRNASVLLHGDFWPGNILWKDGQLVAIIDWEDALLGDPLADVAKSRLEILWAFGIDAMQRFTQHYQSMTSIDFTNLPYWDLWAALQPAGKMSIWAGGDDVTEKNMRAEHRWFLTQAFEKLSVQ